jgi:hypothetical protein
MINLEPRGYHAIQLSLLNVLIKMPVLWGLARCTRSVLLLSKQHPSKDKCDPYNQAVRKHASQNQAPTKTVVAKPVVTNVQENS